MRLFEEGGYTAHGNVLSREQFIPCLGFAHTELNPERMGDTIKDAEDLLSAPLEVLPISRFRDFVIDGKTTIEVGGPDKSFEQVADIPDSFIFADRIELPVGKKLPLWMAGLTY